MVSLETTDVKRLVVKVGTNVITNRNNRLVQPILRQIVEQIAVLKESGISVVLISSGSVISGKEVLGKTEIEDKTTRRQVFSAIGQPRIMGIYQRLFHEYGLTCGQVLATKRDFNPGLHRENMINCYEGLLAEEIVPIVNEDDAVSVTMSMFSDNDELASLTAELINADGLILLSDIDGLYNGHPKDKGTTLISDVHANDKSVVKYIQDSEKGEAEGRGGMDSKLNVAQMSAAKGIPTFIANGKTDNILLDIVRGKKVGTRVGA